jgi:putative endopeptidase
LSAVCLAGFIPLCYAAEPSASGIDRSAMDTSISPCRNFYQYACGSWRTHNPIPPDRARWSRFEEVLEHNLGVEHDILEKAAVPSANRSAIDQKIGDYYASCMDERAIEAKGVQPIAPALERIDKLASKSDIVKELARLHDENTRALFSFSVRPDAKNSNEQIAQIDQGGMGLPDRDYYLNNDERSTELRDKYQQHVRAMFDLLSKAEGAAAPDNAARVQAVMNIETSLAKSSLDRVKRRNPDNTYHRMTVAQLAELTPDLDWKQFFSEIGLPPIKSLNVTEPEYMKSLNALIDNTSLADFKAYFTWHLVLAHAEFLPLAFQEENFRFFGQTLRGAKEMSPRWKRCVESTDRALGEALGQKFVELAFSGPSKAKALQLVGEIEKEMAQDIKSAEWMSAATKDQALTKLGEVTNKIGYPEKWRDYSNVKVIRGDYFGDAARARQFELHRNLSKLGKPVDKTEWSMTPPTVNAYYAPSTNNINFPAGILQPPFYNSKAEDAVNYGAVGVVVGHELTHGFDDQGRRYDGAGNLRDWWSAGDAKAFESRADCIAQEYGGFSPVPGVKLNGKLTLGENAADNGGIHLAYMALMDSLGKRVAEKKDGFTPQQLFFLGYAQIWCENSSEQASRLQALTNPHSPGQFRVNGVMQNLQEFREAFSCKVGDPMVSSDPCRVW